MLESVARNFNKNRVVKNFVKCCYGKREMTTRCSNVKVIGDFDERSFDAVLGDQILMGIGLKKIRKEDPKRERKNRALLQREQRIKEICSRGNKDKTIFASIFIE